MMVPNIVTHTNSPSATNKHEDINSYSNKKWSSKPIKIPLKITGKNVDIKKFFDNAIARHERAVAEVPTIQSIKLKLNKFEIKHPRIKLTEYFGLKKTSMIKTSEKRNWINP